MKLYLQNIVESIQLEALPSEWINFDFAKFSDKKTLFDYQQQALRNAIKALYKYYVTCNQDKKLFFEVFKNNGLIEDLDLEINGNKKYRIFQEIGNDYNIEGNKIAFYHFINRMSFWMATGSGKTLVIVKLIEILGNLIKNNQIPDNDILFLTYREDLIEQFEKHIDEFGKANIIIHLYDLKEYEKVKREKKLKFGNEIDVFCYRSDLISDEQKDKIIDFRNYDNFGKWYILLDEAHKGDKEDSKRQLYYSILSRNGFLFNFSATFTDPTDFATCVFNFNLEKFIQQGYGKHIYISQSNIQALNQKSEFTEQQKQIIILKLLLLHTLIAKSKPDNYYHKPLILTLVNSVNTEDSDLEMFFKEIVNIANNGINSELFEKAKEELKQDLQQTCEFDNEKIEINERDINGIVEADILQYVFNASKNGNIEVLKIPGNRQELIFKLTTSEKPFALVKIGDISEWIKNKLQNYQIVEKFDNESVFKQINSDDSDINILMGSRAFYEGWDSNRPNIILYINIGKGRDAKKFVLQSIGRGVRIEPKPNKRQRMLFLYNKNEISKNEFENIKENLNLIETLFVFGTKAENLKIIVETLKEEKQEEIVGELFEINPNVVGKSLLIPIYRESDKILVDENYAIKFEISEKDFSYVNSYYNYINDKVAIVKFDCQPKIINKIKESLEKEQEFYQKKPDILPIGKPEILLKKIINHFSLRSKEFQDFKQLENEIIHFKQIRITKEKLIELKEKIEKVKNYPKKEEEEVKLKQEYGRISFEEFNKRISDIKQKYIADYSYDKLQIKYLQNHYYIPICLSEDEKIDYITHIIKTKSEIDFINQLEKYLQQENNFFKQFDWWFFSKIDETLDDVHIPYYQPKTNRIEKFKPDFIFWLTKGNEYTILFIDPKGTEYTDAYRKIDGFKQLFKIEKNSFSWNNYSIKVFLKMVCKSKTSILDEYSEFWINSLDELNSLVL